MAAKRKRHDDHEEAHADERWLITYADMITLLMAFFIMMFAMSQLDLAKFQEFREGVISHFGGRGTPVMPGGDGNLKGGAAPLLDMPVGTRKGLADSDSGKRLAREVAKRAERESFDKARRTILQKLARQGLARSVSFRLEARGLVVTILTDKVLFDLGSAGLRPDGHRILDALADGLRQLPNPVAVEGHTDNLPIHSAVYASNWELSTGRASTVVRYLLERQHLPAGRLSAAGYADQHPAASNATPTGRALNRRVEVVVLSALGNPSQKGDSTDG
jgi:chemotaxis protein MotB